MLAHGLAVEVEVAGDRRHTPPLLLQVAYVHKILQVEHWAPWSAQRFHTWGFFDRRYWGIFNRRSWGILDRRRHLPRPTRHGAAQLVHPHGGRPPPSPLPHAVQMTAAPPRRHAP